MKEALEASASDDVVVAAIGKELYEIYRAVKDNEIAEYRRHVPIWNFNMYYGV